MVDNNFLKDDSEPLLYNQAVCYVFPNRIPDVLTPSVIVNAGADVATGRQISSSGWLHHAPKAINRKGRMNELCEVAPKR